MPKYINADQFERDCMFDRECEDMQDVIYKLRDYPSADVVEVVRCKDCKYFELTEFVAEDKSRLGFCNFADNPIWDCDYCSYAERRESE